MKKGKKPLTGIIKSIPRVGDKAKVYLDYHDVDTGVTHHGVLKERTSTITCVMFTGPNVIVVQTRTEKYVLRLEE